MCQGRDYQLYHSSPLPRWLFCKVFKKKKLHSPTKTKPQCRVVQLKKSNTQPTKVCCMHHHFILSSHNTHPWNQTHQIIEEIWKKRGSKWWEWKRKLKNVLEDGRNFNEGTKWLPFSKYRDIIVTLKVQGPNCSFYENSRTNSDFLAFNILINYVVKHK